MRVRGKTVLLRVALGGVLACVGCAVGAQSPGEVMRLQVTSDFRTAKGDCPTISASRVIEIDLGAPPVVRAGSTGWLDFSVTLVGPGNGSLLLRIDTPVVPPEPIEVPVELLYQKQETTIYTNARLASHPLCRGLILYLARV